MYGHGFVNSTTKSRYQRLWFSKERGFQHAILIDSGLNHSHLCHAEPRHVM